MSNLSRESIERLADAIAPEVFEQLKKEPHYTEGYMNAIGYAIEEVIGKVKPEVIGELGCAILGRIGVYESNLWKNRYQALYRYVKTNFAEEYIDGAEYGNVNIYYNGDN